MATYKKASKEKQKAHNERVSRLWKNLEQVRTKLYQQHGDFSKVLSDEKYKLYHSNFRKAYNQCPECGSSNTRCENHDPMWGDGDVICQDCRTYVRMYDAG